MQDDDLTFNEQDDDLKHQAVKPPSVLGEESPSGDLPEEVMDIDEELKKVGLESDDDGVKPLNIHSDLQSEE